jgi:membrane peptidoglycan carboxypeptidase
MLDAFVEIEVVLEPTVVVKVVTSDAMDVIEPSADVTRVSSPLMAVALVETLLSVVESEDCRLVMSLA